MKLDFLKQMLKLNFNLSFTSSKLLAYIIVVAGIGLTWLMKSESVWMWTILGACALFGAKVWSNKLEKKE